MFYSSVLPTYGKEECFMRNAHLSALEAKHATLETRIASELTRPSPDTSLLADLKRRKLRVKEEMVAA